LKIDRWATIFIAIVVPNWISKLLWNMMNYTGSGHNLTFLPEVARSESSPSGLRCGHSEYKTKTVAAVQQKHFVFARAAATGCIVDETGEGISCLVSNTSIMG